MLKNRTTPKILQPLLKLGLVKRVRASLFIQRVSLTLITRAVIFIIGFILSIITARYLGPEGRGVFAVTTAITAMGVQFGNLGLHAANTYYIARDKSLLGKIIGNTLWVSIIGGFIVAAITIGVTHFYPDIVTDVPFMFLVIAVVGIPFGLLYLLGQNIVLGIQRIKVLNAFEIAQAVINVVVIVVLLVLLRQGVFSLIVLNTAVAFLCGIVIVAYLRRIEGSALGFDPGLFKRMVGYGFKSYLSSLFAFLLIRFNILMVNYFLGSGEVGIYSISTSTADILYLLPASIGMILFPQISGMTKGGWDYSKKVAGVTAIIMAAICIVVALIARPFIAFFYGQDFAGAADALLWLLPGVFFLSVETILAQYLSSIGFPVKVVLFWFLGFLLNFILNLNLIPRLGISGAAMTSSLTYFLMFVLILLLSRRYSSLRSLS